MKLEYEEMGNGYLVTISYEKQKVSSDETPQENTKERVLTLLRENGRYSMKEIAVILNKNIDTIKEHIANLKKEGKLTRVGSTKSGYWELEDD